MITNLLTIGSLITKIIATIMFINSWNRSDIPDMIGWGVILII